MLGSVTVITGTKTVMRVVLLNILQCTVGELEAFKVGFDKLFKVLREKDVVLSGLMDKSMGDGTFWYNQAVQESTYWQSMLNGLW